MFTWVLTVVLLVSTPNGAVYVERHASVAYTEASVCDAAAFQLFVEAQALDPRVVDAYYVCEAAYTT